MPRRWMCSMVLSGHQIGPQAVVLDFNRVAFAIVVSNTSTLTVGNVILRGLAPQIAGCDRSLPHAAHAHMVFKTEQTSSGAHMLMDGRQPWHIPLPVCKPASPERLSLTRPREES